MSFVGQVFKLFAYDMGPLGPALLVLLTLGSIWLGYRWSRSSAPPLSVRRLPPDSQPTSRLPAPAAHPNRRCPECTDDNDFLEWRQSIHLGESGGFGDLVPPARFSHYAHYFRCRRCGYDLRLETADRHPDSQSLGPY